jgi:hypothetical protein
MSIQTKVGWRPYVNLTSVWNLLAAAYNADAVGSSSLKTSLYAAYNGESNANDSFGTNNGTAVGGLTYGTGKIGNAFNGNGTNAYVSLPDNSWNFTGTFSINIWAYLSSSSTNSVLYSNYYYSSGGRDYGFILEHQSNGNLRFYMQTSSNSPVILSTSYSGKYNSWKMITITKLQNGSLKMYIDGTSIATNNSTPDIFYNSINYTSIAAARYLGTTYGYLENNGKLDALNVWQKELTQSEITELYNSGNGAQYITDNFYKPTTNDALNTNNGTAVGGLTYEVGKVGTAFKFNGTNAYVSLPNSSGQFNFTGDFSVSMWFKSSNLSTSRYAIGNYKSGGSNGYGWQLYYSVVGGFAFDLRNGNIINQVRKIQAISTNTWYHVVGVRKMGQIHKLYINGVDVSAPQTDGNINNVAGYTANQPMDLGGLSDANAPALCDLDGVNMWNKALTQSEITELYNSGNGKQYPN